MFSQPMKSFKAQVVKQFIGVMVVIIIGVGVVIFNGIKTIENDISRLSIMSQTAQVSQGSLVRSYRT